MDGFVALKNVKKIYQMGEVQIMAAAGIEPPRYTIYGIIRPLAEKLLAPGGQ